MSEPLLQENKNKYVLNIEHEDLNLFYQKAKSAFWTPEEISLSQDVKNWNLLSKNEKFFITHVLAFFAASDGIVNENLVKNFYNEIQYPEARAFYSFQIAMETIHSETYALLIQTYITDSEEQKKVLSAIENFPSIKKKADWALKWTKPENASFPERLIAFVAVEGIFFSGSFCSIFWLKTVKGDLLPGLSFSNELISRDEALHCEFAIQLYLYHLENKLSENKIKEILLEALSIEEEFINESLPVKLIGMNSHLMSRYLKYLTDRLLVQLKCSKHFNVENPFPFMEQISVEGKTNFFEKRVSEYQRSVKVVNEFVFN
jgi:ribonucleoside-diphosphate reductase beta chain